MRISVVALFPEIIQVALSTSILRRAHERGVFTVDVHQLRDSAVDKHSTVDDTPCGGGPGMIMRVDVVDRALTTADPARTSRRILLDAAGSRFRQETARRWSTLPHLTFLCGRYEGIDARAHNLVDEVVSLGDFVLTGGELAAATMIDATVRLLGGALGNAESSVEESFSSPRLEHRQYTRPISYAGLSVPAVLLSGDHRGIARARRRDSLLRTTTLRPELVSEAPLTLDERRILDDDKCPVLEPERSPARGAHDDT